MHYAMHRTAVNTAGAISSIALSYCLWILCSQALTNLGQAPLPRRQLLQPSRAVRLEDVKKALVTLN
jgi:hypothetical protein